MQKHPRHHVSFAADKMVREPVRVTFVNREGDLVNFNAHKKVREEVEIDFMARDKK